MDTFRCESCNGVFHYGGQPTFCPYCRSTNHTAIARGLDTESQIFFYEQDHYYLSNFSAFTLVWQGIRFDTSEAAYQWQKFKMPAGLPESIVQRQIRESIRTAASAHDAFKIAEANREHRRLEWDIARESVMKAILHAKVAQHEYVRRKLLETGDRELIENSWRDDVWGWGKNRDGHNLLGNLWMEVRMEIRTGLVA